MATRTILLLAVITSSFAAGCSGQIADIDTSQSNSGGTPSNGSTSAVAPDDGKTTNSRTLRQADGDQIRASMKKVTLALYAYHDEYLKMPPAYTTDAEGKPLTSWRVLLLPYLGHQDIYNRYDRSKPWDSPENLALSKSTPAAYVDPVLKNPHAGLTSFLGIVGPESALRPGTPIRMFNVEDGIANTGWFVQDLNHPVIWSQPVDLDPEEFLSRSTYTDNPHKQTYIARLDGWVFGHGDTDKHRKTYEALMYTSDGKKDH